MQQKSVFFPLILTDLNLVWSQVLHLGTPVSFPARTFISSSGVSGRESCNGMYFIKRGRVRLSSLSMSGQEKVMLYMSKNVLFNEIPMLVYSYDYVFTCMEHTEAVFWPKRFLDEKLAREKPELIFNLLESLSRKSQSFYVQLSAQRNYSTFGNVCRTLYSMHLFNRVKGAIVPQLTQQEVAAFLGIHRSSLHKALTRLKDEGVIGQYSRKQLSVFDENRLLAYCEEAKEE